MPVKYDHFRPLYPPRPKAAINPATLGQFSGYIAQYKYNDWRVVVYFFPDGRIELYNRHKRPHTAYRLTDSVRSSLRALRLAPGSFHALDGGILHVKTKMIKNRVIFWDVLVHNNEYLVGTTYQERYELLRKICRNPRRYETETHHKLAYAVNQHVWLAPIFKSDLVNRFNKLIHLDSIEGLVLKNPRAKLEYALSEENNGSWQIRVRKPDTNYRF